jgi:hypothetical protein
MFRAIQFAVCVSVLCALPMAAQAAYIPMLVDTTTGTTIFDDHFEGVGLGSQPTATTGSWTDVNLGSGSVYAVTDQTTSGVAANEGAQFLKTIGTSETAMAFTGRAIGLDGSGTEYNGHQIKFTTAVRTEAGDRLQIIYPSVVLDGTVYDMAALSIWNGTTLKKLVNGTDWVTMSQTLNAGQWNTLTISHTNQTNDFAVSVNGGTAESMSSYLGRGIFSFNAIKFLSASDLPSYWDAATVPEPSALALLTIGAVSLLAYAWRKRN